MFKWLRNLFHREESVYVADPSLADYLARYCKGKQDTVRVYLSYAPDDYRLYKIVDSDRLELVTLEVSRDSSDDYEVKLYKDGKRVGVAFNYEEFTSEMLASMLNLAEYDFLEDLREDLEGDEILQTKISKMEDRDYAIKINDSCWELYRVYPYHDHRFAKFEVFTHPSDPNCRYTITINWGRNTRLYNDAKTYSCNHPYMVLGLLNIFSKESTS